MQRDENSKKELKGNARNQKIVTNEKSFDGLLWRLVTAEERNQWLWGYVHRNLQNWNAERKEEKDAAEYPVTVE